MTGSANLRLQRSFDGRRRANNDFAGKVGRTRDLAQLAERDALARIIIGEFFERTVDEDWPFVAHLAQHGDQALRLAQAVGADEMRALGKRRSEASQLVDLVHRIGMTEHGQPECRLADENIAGERLEGNAGRIGLALIVPGDHGSRQRAANKDLSGAKHMAGRMKAHFDIADPKTFAVADRLRFRGEIRAIADRHYGERVARGENLAMTGARMVGMRVGDQGPRHGTYRIDVKISRRAIEASRFEREDIRGLHDEREIGLARRSCEIRRRLGRDERNNASASA